MNPTFYDRCRGYDCRYVHSWPGRTKTAKRGGKHHGARKAAFKAKHA